MKRSYDIRFRFQDGEIFTTQDLCAGLGLFDDNEEVPLIVARATDDADGEWLELGEEFRDEYEEAHWRELNREAKP